MIEHINSLKQAYGSNVRDSKPGPRYKRARKESVSSQESEQLVAVKIGIPALKHGIPRQDRTPANR